MPPIWPAVVTPSANILHALCYGVRALIAMQLVFSMFAASPAHAQVRVDNGRHTRLQRFARDMAYGTAEGLAFAGIDQARDRPVEWGQGAQGYAKRAASNVGEFFVQEGITEGVAAALKHSLDYRRCGCRGIPSRIGHALLGAVADEEPGGAYSFAVPRFAGAYAGALAQASWRPDTGPDRARVILANGSASLAIGALINLMHEFVR